MKTNQDHELKSVISLLRELAENGMLEQGQKESIERAINRLRRAARSHDPAKMQAAIGHVARIFLRASGR